jgi:hypothetical protein
MKHPHKVEHLCNPIAQATMYSVIAKGVNLEHRRHHLSTIFLLICAGIGVIVFLFAYAKNILSYALIAAALGAIALSFTWLILIFVVGIVSGWSGHEPFLGALFFAPFGAVIGAVIGAIIGTIVGMIVRFVKSKSAS